jgi:hypothetical protein
VNVIGNLRRDLLLTLDKRMYLTTCSHELSKHRNKGLLLKHLLITFLYNRYTTKTAGRFDRRKNRGNTSRPRASGEFIERLEKPQKKGSEENSPSRNRQKLDSCSMSLYSIPTNVLGQTNVGCVHPERVDRFLLF